MFVDEDSASLSGVTAPLFREFARDFAATALSKHCCTSGAILTPRSVRCVRPRSRLNSSPPSSASSVWIARVSDGCETPHSSAARVKLSVRDDGQKVTDLVHFHWVTSPTSLWPARPRRRGSAR